MIGHGAKTADRRGKSSVPIRPTLPVSIKERQDNLALSVIPNLIAAHEALGHERRAADLRRGTGGMLEDQWRRKVVADCPPQQIR